MHINILHLLWIVPLSAFAGFVWAAVLMVADAAEEEDYYEGSYDEEERQYSGLLTENEE